MGKDGIAYLFVGPDQGEPLTIIENLINKVIPALRIDGFEVSKAGRTAPAARELYNTAVTRSHELAIR
jgi:ATP-dependent RNA helicase DeaD